MSNLEDSVFENKAAANQEGVFEEFSGSGDESDDDVDEDIEPRLKYERMSNDLGTILNRDAASCLAVHSKFIALGTHWGMIHILDLLGNNIRQKELPVHSTTVNQISIDDNGDYMASCSDDGKVIISGLYTSENNQAVNFDRPVKAVAIDPNFYKSGSGKHFVTGDEKLILHEKGFLSRQKSMILHKDEGTIRTIKWRGSFIAWSNNQGVNVYDMSVRKRISFISRGEQCNSSFARPEVSRCNLCWKDETTLLIGWANTIQICVVRDPIPARDAREPPSRYLEILSVRILDYIVAGLAPHFDSFVVLSYDEQQEGNQFSPSRPHLRLISALSDDEISNDALSIRGFQSYKCQDYHLECHLEEGMFFIVSPKDIVIARQRDEDDHMTWLIEHEEYQEALEYAAQNAKLLKKHTYQSVGFQWFEFLISEKKYDEAAALCTKILGKSKELWENYVHRFAQMLQISAIAKYVPTDQPRLEKPTYEMILNDFLQNRQEQTFYHLIKDWPCDVYRIEPIIQAVLDGLGRDRNNQFLLESLGHLYTLDNKYEKALYIFIRLKHNDVFELIEKHNLFEDVSHHITTLMEFDKNATVKLLLQKMDCVPIEKIVQQLESHPVFLHAYLDQLYQKDQHIGQDYHPMQVKLYAEFDRPRLLPFLKTSGYLSLEDAFAVCKQRSFYDEIFFLLDRMGNPKHALQLITTELKNVERAIDFCKEHDDEDLWEDLVNYSIEKPFFINGLLNNIGTHVDPIILIRKIKEGMEIPGLRNSLVKILQDYNLQISLREGCKKILVSDCYHLLEKLVKQQKKGIRIDEPQTCMICHEKIIVRNVQFAGSIAVFHCHHTFHESCLITDNISSCPICSLQKRKA